MNEQANTFTVGGGLVLGEHVYLVTEGMQRVRQLLGVPGNAAETAVRRVDAGKKPDAETPRLLCTRKWPERRRRRRAGWPER